MKKTILLSLLLTGYIHAVDTESDKDQQQLLPVRAFYVADVLLRLEKQVDQQQKMDNADYQNILCTERDDVMLRISHASPSPAPDRTHCQLYCMRQHLLEMSN